ncbi:Iron-sulfur cluster assembly scaffold protein IscU/NifU-like [Desulfurella amilsii]|uniref:Iron-sulfur cluster assembly scaffold protein IscU/NifU-like n=1 Tax=Desulfurella amilsii TaxID=1562698 RepID=A0A1X4XYQ9_9BACT|nr:Iron-sulfur cluster assembly scaffold protein IscU/NifU-like [Desulfurella amilsii]
MPSIPYSKKVMDLFLNPKNLGEIENPDGQATEGSPACGDIVQLQLKVNKDTQVIEDIKFKSFGCASNIATASIITEIAKGKTIQEAKNLKYSQVVEELGGLPAVKVHCSILALQSLKRAIENYEEKNGLVAKDRPTDEALIKERLRGVIDPNTGRDLIGSKLLSKIEFSDGVLRIYLNLKDANQFANAIKEEIVEKFEYRWDVKSIDVVLLD